MNGSGSDADEAKEPDGCGRTDGPTNGRPDVDLGAQTRTDTNRSLHHQKQQTVKWLFEAGGENLG